MNKKLNNQIHNICNVFSSRAGRTGRDGTGRDGTGRTGRTGRDRLVICVIFYYILHRHIVIATPYGACRPPGGVCLVVGPFAGVSVFDRRAFFLFT